MDQVNIDVYFGTWCPHCKEVVPKFMKSIEVAANPNLKISYTGLPKNFGESDLARARDLKQIPTFIFSKGGKEFGRLPRPEADSAVSVEQAVCDVLRLAHK
jgi:thiol-disulfide isomerase/thioredoxin